MSKRRQENQNFTVHLSVLVGDTMSVYSFDMYMLLPLQGHVVSTQLGCWASKKYTTKHILYCEFCCLCRIHSTLYTHDMNNVTDVGTVVISHSNTSDLRKAIAWRAPVAVTIIF